MNGKKTPKYLVWWHDSYVTEAKFKNPSKDVTQYLLEGVPGAYVEYILFSTIAQFIQCQKYFHTLENIRPGFYTDIDKNYDVIYNETLHYISSYTDILNSTNDFRMSEFFEDYEIKELLDSNNMKLKDMMFCLQHTRIEDEKRIDLSLDYAFRVLKKAKEEGKFKAMYFLVSGHKNNSSVKNKLKKLYEKLSEEYSIDSLFLVFAEDNKRTNIRFEHYPRIFAKLGGISTYFSETKRVFGSGLLEVFASGIVPITYVDDEARKYFHEYGFEVIPLYDIEDLDSSIVETLNLLENSFLRY